MREIKFRGKDYSGQWVYGDLIHKRHDKESVLIQDYKGLGSDVDTTTIGQYTGLKDKNGREIYEGDILLIEEYENDVFDYEFNYEEIKELSLEDVRGEFQRSYKALIYYDEGCFVVSPINSNCCEMYISVMFGNMKYSQPIFEFEIIGNIHDNPELIKEEK